MKRSEAKLPIEHMWISLVLLPQILLLRSLGKIRRPKSTMLSSPMRHLEGLGKAQILKTL